jgi:hypothetical protein
MFSTYRRTSVARYNACVGFYDPACEVIPVPSFVKVAGANNWQRNARFGGVASCPLYIYMGISRLITTLHFVLAPNWTGKLA